MITVTKHTFCLLLFFFITTFAQAQSEKLRYNFEISPAYTNFKEEIAFGAQAKISYNLNFRLLYEFRDAVQFSIGLGYLNTGEKLLFQPFTTGSIDRVEYFLNFNHIFVPVGAKFTLAGFYLFPEFALAYNIKNTLATHTYFTNGDLQKEFEELMFQNRRLRSVTFPIIMNVGREFELGDYIIHFGIKGYYSLNSMFKDLFGESNYQGVGIVLGVSI